MSYQFDQNSSTFQTLERLETAYGNEWILTTKQLKHLLLIEIPNVDRFSRGCWEFEFVCKIGNSKGWRVSKLFF